MKKAKRILVMLLCMLLCISLCPHIAAASTAKITVSDASALPGKEVTLNISITNNPGIMAMTFSVTYDNNNFEFVDYSKGFISTPTYKDHSDKGHVIFVVSETKDKTNSGNMMSLTFKIKEDAKPGKYTISLANHNREKYGNSLHNCFSNSEQNFILPTVKAGSITVEETCENAGHKYSGWKTTTQANCTETGTKERTCVRCGNTEEEIIPITHNFEAEWTVDKAATPEEDGIMSRHCTKCDEVTDKITFSYEEIGGDDTNNTSSSQPSGDTSTDSSSEGESSEGESSSVSTPSDAISSDESVADNTSSDTETQNSTSSDSSTDKKPVINNTVGAKNPLSEVEKLEDYQENIKPDKETDNTSSEAQSSNWENSSSSNKDTESKDADADSNSTENNDKNQSFLSTPTGIFITVIGSLLSIGIIVLGIILIIRNRKTEQN